MDSLQPCYWIVMEHRNVPVCPHEDDEYRILDDGSAYEIGEFIDKIREELYPEFTDGQKKEWNAITDDDNICAYDDIVNFLIDYGYHGISMPSLMRRRIWKTMKAESSLRRRIAWTG